MQQYVTNERPERDHDQWYEPIVAPSTCTQDDVGGQETGSTATVSVQTQGHPGTGYSHMHNIDQR
jgi:hypothetical protein